MFHVMAQHVTQRRRWIRRLGVGVAAITMVSGLAACGGDKTASGDDVMTAASDNLEAAKVVSASFHLVDPNNAVADSCDDPEMAKKALSAATLTVTIDPAGDSTLGKVSTDVPTSGTQMLAQVGAMELAYTVAGEQVALFRLVDGVIYLKADLAAVSELTGEDLETMTGTVPGDFDEAVDALKSGKWVKVDLNTILQRYPQLDTMLTSGYGLDASVSVQEMQQQLMSALIENSEKTVSSDGDTDTVELKVNGKDFALAIEDILATAEAAGIGDPSTEIQELGDGTVNMSVTVTDDHFTKATVDLASAQAVMEPDSDTDLTGAQLIVDINDSAEGLTAPSEGDVVDMTDMVVQLVEAFGSMASGLESLSSEMAEIS